MNQDLDHLRLLSIFHYVVAGVAALFACIPFIHFFLGLAMVLGAFDGKDAPPPWLGFIFMVIGGIFIVMGWAFAICVFNGGRFLARRTHYTYCLVMGAVECVFMPFGTVLGVFTIIVLMRDSVKELFGATAS